MLHYLKIGSCSAQTLAGCHRLDTRHSGDRQEGALRLPPVHSTPPVYSTHPALHTYLYTLPLFLCPKTMYGTLPVIVYFLFSPALSIQLHTLSNTLKAFMPPLYTRLNESTHRVHA